MCISLIENQNDISYTAVVKGDNIVPADANYMTTGNKKLSVLIAARDNPSKNSSVGVKVTRK